MSKKTLTEALNNLPDGWFKLSPEAKAEFEHLIIMEERSKNSKWCLCPKMYRCEFLKRGEYCHG